jgi:hypothetical protein
LILQGDESTALFLSILITRVASLEEKVVAVLCSGSGVLSEKLREVYAGELFTVHDYDKSDKMLEMSSGADERFCVDLKEELSPTCAYDLVLCLGGLRYFAPSLERFSTNIGRLAQNTGSFLVGEVDRRLVDRFAELSVARGADVEKLRLRGLVFRNTLFYHLLGKYRRSRAFRRLVRHGSTERDADKAQLIRLAGFKLSNYYYCWHRGGRLEDVRGG